MQYSAALSLNFPAPDDILIKRSKMYVARGLWEEALIDTSQVCHSVLCRSYVVDAESLVKSP